MNTLEMAIELRKNPNLKATCVDGDRLWKVKCVNGNIMWDDKRTELLSMCDRILEHDNWNIYSEEKKLVKLTCRMPIKLVNGIGELPRDKKVIGDIYVETPEGVRTIRPIDKLFAVPTDDTEVTVFFYYESMGCFNIYQQ